MRSIRLLPVLAAAFALQGLGAAHAEAPAIQPRLDISVVSVGSWRPGDFLRVRVTAPGLAAAQLQGRPVALLINGVAVGSRQLEGADGSASAEFTTPWRGLDRTSFAAELVGTPIDVVAAEQTTLIAQPD